MRLFLIGFMASGKSTIGPMVAERLELDFADLDDLIEADAGQSIPALFASEGETGFRAREAAALRQVGDRDDIVVALGGGTVMDPANRVFARTFGRVVYLKVSSATVLDRVADDADHRPLLQDDHGQPLPRDAMAERIQTMLRDREDAYRDAHVTVDADASPAVVADRVVEAVS